MRQFTLQMANQIDKAIQNLDKWANSSWNKYMTDRSLSHYAIYQSFAEERDRLVEQYDSMMFILFPDF